MPCNQMNKWNENARRENIIAYSNFMLVIQASMHNGCWQKMLFDTLTQQACPLIDKAQEAG